MSNKSAGAFVPPHFSPPARFCVEDVVIAQYPYLENAPHRRRRASVRLWREAYTLFRAREGPYHATTPDTGPRILSDYHKSMPARKTPTVKASASTLATTRPSRTTSRGIGSLDRSSDYRPHVLRASVVQPIFSATKRIVAHWGSCSGSCSLTGRIVLSLTSGGTLVALLMPVSSQGYQSPAIPGWF